MQMLAGTAEHVEMAAREVHVMQRLRHPNLLPLLAYERREPQGVDQDGVTAFYMLFNLFPVTTTRPGSSALRLVMVPCWRARAWRHAASCPPQRCKRRLCGRLHI